MENGLRLLLLLALIAYAPFVMRPVYAYGAAIYEKHLLSVSDNGIGGAAYTDTELAAIDAEVESADGGIPAPAEISAPHSLVYSGYKIQKGDMIGKLAENFGLNQGTLVSVNGIKNSRAIYPGDLIKVPNQDGIMHKVQSGETIEKIAEKYSVEANGITVANELFSEKINAGSQVFVPGAKLDYAQLQEINGDLFIWPIRGRITSRYGYRISPVSGRRAFHTGIDLGAPTGVPIKAAMSGRVVSAGYNNVFGNYVVLAHHSNYRTLYGHMSSIRSKSGAYVRTGEVIGYVGNTGQSTGSHLHFTVYKNGVTINPLLFVH